jgi:hypothetical protein
LTRRTEALIARFLRIRAGIIGSKRRRTLPGLPRGFAMESDDGKDADRARVGSQGLCALAVLPALFPKIPRAARAVASTRAPPLGLEGYFALHKFV